MIFTLFWLTVCSCSNTGAEKDRGFMQELIHGVDIEELNRDIRGFNNSRALKKIAERKNLGRKDKQGYTAIMAAAESNNVEALEALLNKKYEEKQHIDIDAENSDGESALVLAVKKGFYVPIELLLSHGAKIENRDREGKTVLFEAIINEQAGILKLLLTKGANVNAQDKYGRTPLMVAYSVGNNEIISLIEKHNPNLEIKDVNGNTVNAYKQDDATG